MPYDDALTFCVSAIWPFDKRSRTKGLQKSNIIVSLVSKCWIQYFSNSCDKRKRYEGSVFINFYNISRMHHVMAWWESTVVDSMKSIESHLTLLSQISGALEGCLDTVIGRPLTRQTFALIQLSSYGCTLRIGLIQPKHSGGDVSMEDIPR